MKCIGFEFDPLSLVYGIEMVSYDNVSLCRVLNTTLNTIIPTYGKKFDQYKQNFTVPFSK